MVYSTKARKTQNIKCYPQIHMLRDVYYETVIVDSPHTHIPIAESRFGGNSHKIYKLQGNKEFLGFTSTVMWDWDPNNELEAPPKEVKLANDATWVHFSQIKNATGYLDGFEDDKKPFQFCAWPGDGSYIGLVQ